MLVLQDDRTAAHAELLTASKECRTMAIRVNRLAAKRARRIPGPSGSTVLARCIGGGSRDLARLREVEPRSGERARQRLIILMPLSRIRLCTPRKPCSAAATPAPTRLRCCPHARRRCASEWAAEAASVAWHTPVWAQGRSNAVGVTTGCAHVRVNLQSSVVSRSNGQPPGAVRSGRLCASVRSVVRWVRSDDVRLAVR